MGSRLFALENNEGRRKMARNLKGIVLEIGGDTSGLQKALKGVNTEIKNTQSQLKDVERLLKMDPGNTELLKQKQRLLGDEIDSTKKKLESLKQANQNAAKALANNAEYQKAYEPLKKQLDETGNKMKELKAKDEDMKRQLAEGKISQGQYDAFKKELQDVEEEHKRLLQAKKDLDAQFSEGHIDQSQYDALQRELVETEQHLKSLEKEAANANLALQKIGQAGDKLQKVGGQIEGVGKKFMPVSGAVAALGVASGKMASDFDDSVAQINTLLDDDTHLKSYKNSIIDLSNETRISADIMSQGMYQAISSLGDGGKETEKIFGTMAKSAKAGGAEVADSVSLISAGMKGYNQVNDETAQKISDLAFQTAKLGVTTFPEMAKSMQPLFPLSSSLTMSYEELFGVMATGTGVTGNTAEVSTQLKAVLSNLMKPTGEMQKVMEKYGYANAQAMIQSEGFSGVLRILQAETGGQSDKMAKLFSSTEALTLMTALTGTQFDTFNDKLGQMNNATGATATAYDKLNTSGDKIRKSVEQLKNTMIELGGALMEVLAPAIEAISKSVAVFARWFSGLSDTSKRFIVIIGMVVAAIGPVLIIIGKMATGVGALMKVVSKIGPAIKAVGTAISKIGSIISALKGVVSGLFTLIAAHPVIATITVIIGAVVLLYNKCEWFRDAVNATWKSLKKGFHDVWDDLVKFFTVDIPEAWNSVVEFFRGVPAWWAGVWNELKQSAEEIWNSIVTAITGFCDGVKQVVSDTWNGIKETVTSIMTGIWNAITEAWNAILTAISTVITAIWTTITTIWNAILTTITTIITAIWNTITAIWNAILSTITTIVTAIWNTLTTIWMTIQSTITSIITAIRSVITSAWNAIRSTIQSVMSSIRSVVTSIWNAIKSFVSSVAQSIYSAVQSAFNRMLSAVRNIIGNIRSTIVSGFQSAISYITSLPGQAFRWGADIIDNIVSGIRNSIGNIVSAVSSVASTIRSYLHFSVPDVGPLSDADEYGGDFISLLESQMRKALPNLQRTVEGVAQAMSINPQVSAQQPQISGLERVSETIAEAVRGMQPQAAGVAAGNIIIPVYIGQGKIDEIVVAANQRANYRSGGH